MRDSLRDAGLLRRLRDGTADLHGRLDGAPLMCDLPRPALTRATYVACLRRIEPVYRAIDGAVSAFLAETPGLDLDRRRKAPALAQDLRHFGAVPGEPCPAPRLTHAAEAWGALYVVEGATLGGSLISRNLAEKPWFDGLKGRGHFAGYGAGTGAMWTAFRLALLAEEDRHAGFGALAVDGARAAFALFCDRVGAPHDSGVP